MFQNRWLLVCDIDGTLLLPDSGNPGLPEFTRVLEQRRDDIVFAVNTGRSLPRIAEVSEQGPIARPDWIISDVGTSIFSSFSQDSMDAEWREKMFRPWGREEIRAALSFCSGIVEQEVQNQAPGKLSYYLDKPVAPILKEVERIISPWKASCKALVTMDYYLDIMPIQGGKGRPISYLADKIGISPDRVIVAGDSGNDIDMLSLGYRSIIVANHTSDLHFLFDRPLVYMAQKEAALGVLEGLAHFGLI